MLFLKGLKLANLVEQVRIRRLGSDTRSQEPVDHQVRIPTNGRGEVRVDGACKTYS